jgi:hypothetical protein
MNLPVPVYPDGLLMTFVHAAEHDLAPVQHKFIIQIFRTESGIAAVSAKASALIAVVVDFRRAPIYSNPERLKSGSPSWTRIELSALFRLEKFVRRSKYSAKPSLLIRE